MLNSLIQFNLFYDDGYSFFQKHFFIPKSNQEWREECFLLPKRRMIGMFQQIPHRVFSPSLLSSHIYSSSFYDDKMCMYRFSQVSFRKYICSYFAFHAHFQVKESLREEKLVWRKKILKRADNLRHFLLRRHFFTMTWHLD